MDVELLFASAVVSSPQALLTYACGRLLFRIVDRVLASADRHDDLQSEELPARLEMDDRKLAREMGLQMAQKLLEARGSDKPDVMRAFGEMQIALFGPPNLSPEGPPVPEPRHEGVAAIVPIGRRFAAEELRDGSGP